MRAVDDLRAHGIDNVLALRGDAAGTDEPGTYRYARDLISRLAEEGFCVGAAAYPEGHIACDDARANIEHLKQKQDAGASFFVTQLFFDNEFFYRSGRAARNAGVTAPIACGIMPFLGKAQIQRMVFMCGASLPSPVVKLLALFEDRPDRPAPRGHRVRVRPTRRLGRARGGRAARLHDEPARHRAGEHGGR